MSPRAVRVSLPALWIRRWSDSSPSAAAWCSSLCRSGGYSAGIGLGLVRARVHRAPFRTITERSMTTNSPTTAAMQARVS